MRRKVREPWPLHSATAGATSRSGALAFALRLGRHIVLHVTVSDHVVILDCFRRIVAGGTRFYLEISIAVDAARKEVTTISRWTDDLAAWPEVPGKQMVYGESSLIEAGTRVIQRIENFC